jgi:hypothetical protein
MTDEDDWFSHQTDLSTQLLAKLPASALGPTGRALREDAQSTSGSSGRHLRPVENSPTKAGTRGRHDLKGKKPRPVQPPLMTDLGKD